jgi:hypothetical protein
MSDDTTAMVWLYEDGNWKTIADPIPWSTSGSDGVLEKYAEAGYTESNQGDAKPFLALGLDFNDWADHPTRISLFVRSQHPQCLIDIDGPAGSSRALYAARLPDGLDLFARWVPITQAGMLTALVMDLIQPAMAYGGKPDTSGGIVEAVMRRALQTLP